MTAVAACKAHVAAVLLPTASHALFSLQAPLELLCGFCRLLHLGNGDAFPEASDSVFKSPKWHPAASHPPEAPSTTMQGLQTRNSLAAWVSAKF